MNPIKDEPVITAVITLLGAALTLLMAFGVHLTEVQIAATGQFVQDSLIVGFLVRSQVTPKAHAPVVTIPAPVVVDPLASSTATGA